MNDTDGTVQPTATTTDPRPKLAGPKRAGFNRGSGWAGWGLAISLAIVCGAYQWQHLESPGVTVDEPINLSHGRTLVTTAIEEPLFCFDPRWVFVIWSEGHDHPPLARAILGVSAAMGNPNGPLGAREGDLWGGRLASAVFGAAIVFIGCRWATRIAGIEAGFLAGLAIATLPRLLGHGRLASPEVIHTFFVLAALAAFSQLLSGDSGSEEKSATRRMGPSWSRILAAALLTGAALLTKLTAILIFPIALAAALTLGPKRNLAVTCLSLVIGGALFITGWPWLWPWIFAGETGSETVLQRLSGFLLTGVDRATVYVWYLGEQWPKADRPVPWHYVWIILASTTPLMTLLGATFGFWSARSRLREPTATTLLIALAVYLTVFTLPVERYDGERIFLTTLPLLGILAGVGWGGLIQRFPTHRIRMALRLIIVLGFGIEAARIPHYEPFLLSYYNIAVGGLGGANRLGLETTYWGDSVTREMLDILAEHVPPGTSVPLFPTLYVAQPAWLRTPAMVDKRQILVPGHLMDEDEGWALFFHREGYLQDGPAHRILEQGEVIHEITRDGIWLTRLVRYRRQPPTAQPAPSP